MAVVDLKDPDGKITMENWLLVENEILKAMMADIEDSDPLNYKFDGAGWLKGVKIVGCGSDKALEFLTRTITNMGEPWEGAKLNVLPTTAIPIRQKLKIWIPPPAQHEDESILKLLAKQNPALPVKDWKKIHSRPCKTNEGKVGKELLMAVDRSSVEMLKRQKCLVKYGLGVLRIFIQSDDDKKVPETASGAN